jgi:hypothetical protein
MPWVSSSDNLKNYGLAAILPHLNASDFSFLPGNTAAANDAGLAAAIAAAVTAGKSLYIPGYGLSNPYLVSAPLAHPGAIRIFGDPGKTYINNSSNTSALVTCTGGNGALADIFFQHTTANDASTGNGIEVNNVNSWSFERLTIYNTGYGFIQTGGSFFSNYMETVSVLRVNKGAIKLTGGTGSQWNNTYVNNADAGASQVCSDHMVNLEGSIDESVFNQFNIEWAKLQPGKCALQVNSQGSLTLNSLHIEQVHHTGFDGAYVLAYFRSQVVIDGFTIKFCDIAPTGSQGGGRTLLRAQAGAGINARGVYSDANSNTATQTARLGNTDSDAASRVRIESIRNDVWTTASTGIGLRQIDDPMFVTKAGALTTTELPLSGMIGIDTTNSKIYVNVAGTVKSVTVA